jgi:DNA-binding CsgD family transcriptional regulator
MKRNSFSYPPQIIDVAKETIFEQTSLLTAIRRTAWWLFCHELSRKDPETGKLYTPYKALDNALKWMGEQSEMLERVKQEPTQMQRRLLQMLAEGKSGKQIALEIGIHEQTLRTHFSRMRSRIGVETMYQLIAVGVKKGWVRVPSTDNLHKLTGK